MPLLFFFSSDLSRLDSVTLGGSQTLLSGQVESLEFGRSDTSDTVLLVLTQPRLLGVTQHAAGQEVDDETDNDKDERNRVQVVDGVAKDLDTNGGTPKVASQERNVEKGG